MKTKNKFFLFVATFIFLGVFLVRVNSVRASDYYDCMNDTSTNAADCDGLEGDPVMPTGGGTIPDYSYTQEMCNDIYGTGYVPNADGTGCDLGQATGYGYDQTMCDSIYGTGYVPNSSGTGCDPLVVGGSDYATCIAEGGTPNECIMFDDGSHCTTNAECINKGAGNSCDQTMRLCSDSSTGGDTASGDICFIDSQCNWYSKCKLGDRGAAGICQGYLNFSDPQNTLNALGLPNGSTISPSGVVTAPNGTITQLTPAQIVQVQAVNGVTSGNTNVNYTPAGPKCGAGFRDVGGVCFPTNTGLSSASISDILMSLFGWLMGLFTTFAVLAFVISGIQYFMASGDESMAEKAKENATHAVIGIIIGLSGFIIVKAIAAALSGTSVIF
jgi:hypothetical protein